jgi:DNA-directed RNA polymerase alpha subunit
MMVYSKDDVYYNVKKALDEIKAVIGGEEANPSPISVGIETLDLSVRAYNCLHRAGITTIQELIAFDQRQAEEYANGRYSRTWLGIRNMGRNTLKEVHDRVLDRIGYEINVNIA